MSKKIPRPIHKIAAATFPEKIRIQSGRWRGRVIHLPATHTIRPTTSVNKETLFNWLGQDIVDAICVDIFAGSGALGIEALSRGAAFVSFIDADRGALQNIEVHLDKFVAGASQTIAEYLCWHLPHSSHALQKAYDIAFIDPPFHQDLALPTLYWLAQANVLKSGALVFLEVEATLKINKFASCWQILKHKKRGSVEGYLLRITK